MPAWLKARIAQDSGVGRAGGQGPSKQTAETGALARGQTSWPSTEGEPRDLQPRSGPLGQVWSRTEVFPGTFPHGSWRLDAVDGADSRVFSWLTGDPALQGLDPRRAIYLDTETTGLAGGAGTWVFMVGLGRFLASGDFELWQGFMRGPEDESALLAEAARRIAAADSLVSFFGKSFDRHRLEDKMRLCKVPAPFDGRAHLDLYHPLRRLFGQSFPDGRLATLEAQLCGLERGIDLPGSQAPAAWFDYLAKRPHRLEGVFHHNRLDVLSLATLLAWLGHAAGEARPDGQVLEGPATDRRRGLVTSIARAGDLESALSLAEQALVHEPAARDLALARAELLYRLRRDEVARAAFTALLAGPEDSFSAPVHLAWAKFLEHRERDRAAALEACRHAQRLQDLMPPGRPRAKLVRDLDARLTRLAARTGG